MRKTNYASYKNNIYNWKKHVKPKKQLKRRVKAEKTVFIATAIVVDPKCKGISICNSGEILGETQKEMVLGVFHSWKYAYKENARFKKIAKKEGIKVKHLRITPVIIGKSDAIEVRTICSYKFNSN